LWSTWLVGSIRWFALGAESGQTAGSSARHVMAPTPRWTRPAGAATWFLTVAVRFSADHLHQLLPSELFSNIVRQGGGHPTVPAEVVAAVMVLQALEGLSDREAISALRRDIVWKVACGCALTTRASIPPCWCTGATASAPRPGHSGSCRRSARWWSKPGCFSGSTGGCWTPPSWRTRSLPRTPSPS
jgi:hypothetical protein